MTLLFQDGFESGPNYRKPQWVVPPPTVVLSATAARTGSYYIAANNTNGKLSIPASAKLTVGCGYWVSATSGTAQVLSFWGDSGATQHLSLVHNFATGLLELRRGSVSGTLLATGTRIIDQSAWRSIQMQATCADSGGRCIVRFDNVNDIDFTGDTKNGGTNSTFDAFTTIGGTNNGSIRQDDFYVCDGVDATATQGAPNNDFLGDVAVFALRPNGVGTYSQLLGSDADSVNNHLNVDEIGPNTTDWNGSATIGQHDTYAADDLPSTVSAVIAVQPVLVAQKSDAGAGSLKPMIRENGVNTLDTAVTLSTSWAIALGALRGVKPSNGTLWTVADVNGLEVGAEVA